MKTKYEQIKEQQKKIKEQQKKVRNKEILYRVKEIFKYNNEEVTEDLKYIVTQLHLYGKMGVNDIEKLIPRGYKIVETTPNKELTNNERYEILKKTLEVEDDK